MTKKETTEIKRAAKAAMNQNGIAVYMTNMILLESGGTREIPTNYIMFRDKATGKEWQCHTNNGVSWMVEEYTNDTATEPAQADKPTTESKEAHTMNKNELRATIETLESIHAETLTSGRNPHETARRFIREVGTDTAAAIVAAMVRRLHWDGRISRQARQWAEGVSLSEEWERRTDDAYTDRIHTAHLSQIAEAMPAELEHAAAETQTAAERYLEQVEQADTLDELDAITETAANDDTLTAAEYEAFYSAALRKAQGWDPQNKPQEPTENAVEILVNGHLVQFSACTAIAASIGDTARQPALFVHDCTDRDGNGDGVIFGVDTPPETPEEAAALLEEHLDTCQETLKTVEPAHRYTAETYQDNAGRAHLAVLDRSGTCVYYLVDAGRELIQDAILALCKDGDPVAEQWDGGEDDPAAAYRWICSAVEAHNGGAWEADPTRLFEAVSV